MLGFANHAKSVIKKNPRSRFSFILSYIYSLFVFNKISDHMKRCHIEVYGKNNVIDLGSAANYLTDCHIYVGIIR